LEKHLQKIAILSVIKALPDWMDSKLPQGRLQALMNRLQRETQREFLTGRRLYADEVSMLVGKVQLWVDQVGWDKKPRHVCTITSFLIYLVVDYLPENRKLLELLEEIYNYFERIGKNPVSCEWAGTRAAGIFSEIFA